MDSKKIILHDHYNLAFKLAEDFITKKISSKKIMLIIGPTGVGKTTLRHQLLRKWYGNPMQWPAGTLKIIEVMATQPENSYFKSSALVENLHRELIAPDFRFLKPINSDDTFNMYTKNQMQLTDKSGISFKYGSSTEKGLWSIFLRLAKEREVELFSIEHANSLVKTHSDSTPAEHMRNLMSINEAIGSRLILTSATNGFKLWQDDRENCDRFHIVSLHPYNIKVKEERISFMKLLYAISSNYEFEPADLFKSMYQEIAAVTGTAIRDIVSLFDTAKSYAEYSKRTKISKSDLLNALPSLEDCEGIHADIKLFRSKVKPCSAEELKLLVAKHARIK